MISLLWQERQPRRVSSILPKGRQEFKICGIPDSSLGVERGGKRLGCRAFQEEDHKLPLHGLLPLACPEFFLLSNHGLSCCVLKCVCVWWRWAMLGPGRGLP